jgi:hypothetical protein
MIAVFDSASPSVGNEFTGDMEFGFRLCHGG